MTTATLNPVNQWRPPQLGDNALFHEIPDADAFGSYQQVGSRPGDILGTLTVRQKLSRPEVEELGRTAESEVSAKIQEATDKARGEWQQSEAYRRINRLERDIAGYKAELSTARQALAVAQRNYTAAVLRGDNEAADRFEAEQAAATNEVNSLSARLKVLDPELPGLKQDASREHRRLVAEQLRELDAEYAEAFSGVTETLCSVWQDNAQRLETLRVARERLHSLEISRIVDTVAGELSRNDF